MSLSRERLTAESEATGFRSEVLEKVIHLLNLLTVFQRQPGSVRRTQTADRRYGGGGANTGAPASAVEGSERAAPPKWQIAMATSGGTSNSPSVIFAYAIYTRQPRVRNDITLSSCDVQFQICRDYAEAIFPPTIPWCGTRYYDPGQSGEIKSHPGPVF